MNAWHVVRVLCMYYIIPQGLAVRRSPRRRRRHGPVILGSARHLEEARAAVLGPSRV